MKTRLVDLNLHSAQDFRKHFKSSFQGCGHYVCAPIYRYGFVQKSETPIYSLFGFNLVSRYGLYSYIYMGLGFFSQLSVIGLPGPGWRHSSIELRCICRVRIPCVTHDVAHCAAVSNVIRESWLGPEKIYRSGRQCFVNDLILRLNTSL